ncbi:laccase-7-like isoform X2 [Tripterygium wilfordii]|uniref:laccase-7-like isoform X2 n=1 Tax=Tripterygium wilfordii TaxID=458696 RepID=UPI0018F80223|nr:laccase-7-like isoform X2 [Tripterygium wilfordii]
MAKYYLLLPLLGFALTLLCTDFASAAIVEHWFNVQNLTVNRLCKEQVITAVNGRFPGPTLTVREGDTLIVHVFNKSPNNLAIHWHGVSGLSPWADGPSMITQCPIRTGHNYTYKFNITKHEGTLFWHAHDAWLRATVFGAIIVRPRLGHSYPFPKPYREVPILLGEWWNISIIEAERLTLESGGPPIVNDAYFINGLLGDTYPCSVDQMFRLNVKQGKTYLLRIVNTGLDNNLFFKIANHSMTVVGIDGAYTTPYVTDVLMVALGQTTDVLVTANQPVGSYYMASSLYDTIPLPGENTTTRGLIVYEGANPSVAPSVPVLPDSHDTNTTHRFQSNLTGLPGSPHFLPVPLEVNERMFVTTGLALIPCPPSYTCNNGIMGNALSSSMNNKSFVPPRGLSMMEAFYYNVSGIYTTDFPDNPPKVFDYVNTSISFDQSLIFTERSTSVKKLKFNSTVEVVLQDTAIVTLGNHHPIHLHGFSFHVLAQGFGNYDPVRDSPKFNLINPPYRNTVLVPTGGWTVVRFRADNPGVWFVHCHLDSHMSWGMAMAFVVENGPTPATRASPPPPDLPKC